MADFYLRFGRRFKIPSTIEILDELAPGYRARLGREGRARPPKSWPPPVLPAQKAGSVKSR